MIKRTHYALQLKKAIGKTVSVVGFVHDSRILGGINFLLLRDPEGIVQITAPKAKVSAEVLKICKGLHQEDVIAVKGRVVRSKIAKAGLEIIPSKIEVISRAEVPLPLDPRGVTKANLDTQLEWRALYLRTEEARAIFKIQAEIIKAFREFCEAGGYQEIQPPVIISSASEGGAELFPLPYFEKQAFLAQSPQLYKQICALAFEKVFSISPVFRAEKFDQPTHLNEIRQLDIEQLFIDDMEAMGVLEDLLIFILEKVKGVCRKELKTLGGELVVPKKPFRKITYTQAVKLLQANKEEVQWGKDFSKVHERVLGRLLGEKAFFIKDWPSEVKAFYAMPYTNDPRICRAFDLIYEGIEVASGTQRIHQPELLVRRLKEKGLAPESFSFYINAFRYGAPIHSGFAIGLERLTMAITGKRNIREVTMFPRDRTRIWP